MAASYSVVMGLALQAVLLSVYLWLRSPGVMSAIMRRMAAFAARRISRRLRLAVLVSGLRARHRRERAHAGAGRGAVRAGGIDLGFKQRTTPREVLGIALIVAGVGLLLWALG